MRLHLLAWLIVGICVAGSVQAQTDGAGGYVLQPGDLININILEDPSLNSQALVRPDGKISMPLAGTIVVAGSTPEAAQELIRSRLAKDFVEPPTVTVALATIGAFSANPLLMPAFYVLGEVNAPGRYNFDEAKPVTVLQALAVAGGLGVFAASKRIQIRRYADNVETVQLFDYDAVDSGEGLLPPLFIEDGDVIVVPESGLFN